MYSRCPEACVSATLPERLPRDAEQSTIRIFHFFFPSAILESLLYSPGFQGYSNNLVPQLRIVAKRDNMLSLSPLANQVKRFPEIFSTFQIAFLWKEKNGCKSGSMFVGRPTCLLSCLSDASWRVTSPFGALIGPPTAFPRTGPSVP